MSEPGPITWALDLLQAHNIPPLAEGEDERRLLGELVSLGWDVSWDEDWEWVPELQGARVREYEVRGRAKWLPVGEVRFTVKGETLAEAAMFGLAMALDVQGGT